MLGLIACNPEKEEFARASTIQTLDEAIGGPKAIAQPGDFLLETDHYRVAILAGEDAEGERRSSMGPGLYGGSLVDADLQRTAPEFQGGKGRDQFAEMFTTVSMNILAPRTGEDVQIISDGSDGGAAVIRVKSPGDPFISLLKSLWAIVTMPPMHITTDYVAQPGVPWLTVKTTVVMGNETGEMEGDSVPADSHVSTFPLIDVALQTGMVAGDFYLSGGSMNVFAPGIGFDEDGAVSDANLEGKNTFVFPFQFEYLAGVGDGISYGIAAAEGDLFVPLFTSSQTVVVGGAKDGDGTNQRFSLGQGITYERYFYIGEGDVGSIVDQYLASRSIPSGHVSGQVLEEGTMQPVSGVNVLVYKPGEEMPWSQWETDVRRGDDVLDGSFAGNLPVGDWELLVHHPGRPDGARIPVSVVEGGEAVVNMAAGRPGVFRFEVVDETGRPIPAKVSLFRQDGVLNRDPAKGDAYVAGGPESVVFPMYGSGEIELPPGTYRAVASRGLEYETDTSETFIIDESRSHFTSFQLERSVLTDGWISADFHVHASPSQDSGVALADRVRTMACEGVEFFASTDHDFITDYGPVVENLNMEEWVKTATGVETTTIEIGHFLAFPIENDFLAEAQGALDWTGLTPYEIVTSLEQQGQAAGYDPMVFVAHPRAGILGYFDQYGLNPYGGTKGLAGMPGTPAVAPSLLTATNPLLKSDNLMWEFDALELMGTKQLELVRTPTQPELDDYAAGEEVGIYSMLERTMAEQEDLENDIYRLGYGHEGQIDDWFTLLNLGFKFTALGNSDTHGWTSTESGCPRNYVMSETDDPAFIDAQAVADAVANHKVVASYGPFVQLWVDGATIGSEIQTQEPVEIMVEARAPTWMDLDRVELYENGTLIQEWLVEDSNDPFRFTATLERELNADAWYVAIALGDGDLSPVFTPVEIPVIDLQLIVTEALAGLESVSSFLDPAVPIPRTFPIHPYAVTNPIWVDRAGDGFDAPGLPTWLREPVAPEEE